MNDIIKQKMLEAKRSFRKTRGLYGAPVNLKRDRKAKTPGSSGSTKTGDIDSGEESGDAVVIEKGC